MIFVSALALPLQYEDTYGSSSLFKLDKPFLTEKRAFISLVNSSTDSKDGNVRVVNDQTIKALITSGDTLSNNYTFANGIKELTRSSCT
jgi:hypothetical protein